MATLVKHVKDWVRKSIKNDIFSNFQTQIKNLSDSLGDYLYHIYINILMANFLKLSYTK